MTTHYGTLLGRAAAATALGAVALVAPVAVAPSPVAAAPAAAPSAPLPLGDTDLYETRTTRTVAKGVTLTRIVRGTAPAAPGDIPTTRRGPWVVSVLTLDPRRAPGRLEATHGPDLARVEPTTELVRDAAAIAGVNASFFTYTANRQYPGDPVGLHVSDGQLLSEPGADPNETDLLVDAAAKRLRIGRFGWSGQVRNRRTGAAVPLEFLNHPPVVPAACGLLPDPTRCTQPGDVVRFTPEFGATTPAGPGVEVVLDRRGCTVRTATVRGTALTAGQTSLQATGRDTVAVLAATGAGSCLATSVTLKDEAGRPIPMREGLFGVNGRFRLTAGGEAVVPDGSGTIFARNPRTVAGTTADGRVVLVTIDGRQPTSVGTTLDETAATALALGMTDAVNLDGGGSTAMAVDGALVNHPSGPTERAVGDALAYRP